MMNPKSPQSPQTPASPLSPSPLISSPASSFSSADSAQSQFEDVAIIGMSCRTAGGNDSPEKLWKFIMEKKDASGESPSWRWEPWKNRDPRNAKVIEKTINKGYFIQDLENFDAAFFGISPKEAEQMDPHQRLGLEVTWEALEDAGISPKALSGSDTAVYIGVDSDDYSRLLLEDLPNIEAWMGIGTTAHGIPNRISYHLDLMGPSAAVDAACASSLVAVNAGRQAILAGESRVAIVGGVNVCLSPALFHMLGAAGALSPDGVCLSFDDDAHGYARGEGAAVLILKKLSDAITDGDQVLATIKGSAIAQDGKTNGIMAPNAKAQELVARKALKQANIDPLSVRFIEAHATSTSLGDPTEISAISAVYGAGRPRHAPAIVGSIKPNVGHLEAAAGAISMIKAVLAVKKGVIPPQTRLNKLNSKVDWENSGLHVVKESMKWSDSQGPRRAAICSYGYGGTVSHAIVEQSPQWNPTSSVDEDDQVPTILLLSAPQGKQRLSIQSATQAEWISGPGRSESLKTISATLSQRRAHHDFRAAFVVSSHTEAAETLASFSKGIESDWVSQGRILENNVNKDIVWVFSGHGSQWSEMGKELLQNAIFYNKLTALDKIVIQELGYSAVESLRAGKFEESDHIQVLTYLVQVGLSEVLRSKGIRPRAVIGHSVGEIAASVTAGCISAEEGTIVVTRRARLYGSVKGSGGMYLVNLPFAKVAAELCNRTDIVAAIESSPSSCVVSGALVPLEDYITILKHRSVRVFQVKTDIAFHSPMLENLSQPLKDALSDTITPQPPTIKLYSTSNSDPRSAAFRDADYWVQNMVSPVWLNTTVAAAIQDNYRIFLEVSAHPIVAQSIDETFGENGLSDFTTIHTMKKGQSAERCVLKAVAELFVRGASIDFSAFLGSQWSKEVPKFTWSHKPFWKEVSSGSTGAQSIHDVDLHNMLGQRTVIAGGNTTLFTTALDDSIKPFPRPHQLHGVDIIPAAVYINTFLNATGATVLSDMQLRVPLAVTEDRRSVQVLVEGGIVKVATRLSSSDDLSWVTHSTASWKRELPVLPCMAVDVQAIINRIGTSLPNTFSIDYLTKVGVSGIAFPWAVTKHYGNSQEMLATIDNDPENEIMTWNAKSWAPTLDAAASVGSTIFSDDPKLRIVSHIEKLILISQSPPPKIYHLHVTQAESPRDIGSRSANVNVLNIHGEVIARFESIRLTDVDVASRGSASMESLVHQIAWTPARLSDKPHLFEKAAIISQDYQTLERYSNELQLQVPTVLKLRSSEELRVADAISLLHGKQSAIVLCPGPVHSFDSVASSAHRFIWDVAIAVKFIVEHGLSAKLFIITDKIYAAESATALAQGPLYGLARVVASEHSDIWGGLIDNEGPGFPIMPFKYVHAQDVIRYVDGVPRVARMRPFAATQIYPASRSRTLLPKPEGTYVVTGGLGALGLETCDFLIAKGARRIVIVSRRALPPRRQWLNAPDRLRPILDRIRAMEDLGASIHVIPLDIGAGNADELLIEALDRLSLPAVLGVIHASGILEDNLLMETTSDSFARVLSPKISGAIALHKAFPPGVLDFFVLYSSIGELVGTSGQSSYASGNSFLDVLAAHRRSSGDNAIAFQWTAWRGLGMATATDFLALELQSKGITDITSEEAFRAWEHVSKYDVDHAVVTRSLAFDESEVIPCALLEEIVVRQPRAQDQCANAKVISNGTGSSDRPTAPAELRPWVEIKIRESVASVMKISDIEEIDVRIPLADFGVDSVMSIALRQRMQSALQIKIPQTLMWNYPTIVAMTEWFLKQNY
ncbi:ketoacyl-synt-domain-containing protein [Plenodomus tracheiphilus IPT5]|uniref:6-methylsalicylic acid synthase n=1 Tax=Plenodomus tracheiphilus IPT5 TaxID=1408161 RepID=A0A6A7ART4_9PLEO|nr:ketoacyl-synt-domain-containing protein [Plenodomus tracheiphilus IPT5]